MSNDQPRSTTRYSRYSRAEAVPPKAPAANPAVTKPEAGAVDMPIPDLAPPSAQRPPSAVRPTEATAPRQASEGRPVEPAPPKQTTEPRPAEAVVSKQPSVPGPVEPTAPRKTSRVAATPTPSKPTEPESSLEDITRQALNAPKHSATIQPERNQPSKMVDLQPPVPDVDDYEPEPVRSPATKPVPEVSPVRQTITSWKDQEELEEPALAPDWVEDEKEIAPAPASVAPVIRALEPEASEDTPLQLRKNVPTKLKKEGPNFAQRMLANARAKAVPALQRSALWLAHNLQRRELRKRYCEAVIFSHNRVIDRKLEKLFFIPTLKGTVKFPAPERGIHYEGPIPSRVFDWVLASLPADLREYAFIDFRAGRGRTVLLATKRQFDRIIGFEYDGQLFDDLQMNVAQYPRSLMKCRNIDCYRGDLEGIRVPNQASILWFSSAWRCNMIPGVMDYVRQTYSQSPRVLYVVFANVGEEDVLPDDPLFQRIEPNMSERVKLKLLSPMEFQIYRAVP